MVNSLNARSFRLSAQDYFFKGDIVVLSLGAPPKLFRLHRFALTKYSEVFRDMFGLPSPAGAAEGNSDENPIRLPDEPSHFNGVLNTYYGDILAPIPDSPDIDFTLGVLRVAFKYRFVLARDRALKTLRSGWSKDSLEWKRLLTATRSPSVLADAIKVINASRELQLQEFLGPAFYLLWISDPHKINATHYASMRPEDIVLLVEGTRKALTLYEKKILDHNYAQQPAVYEGMWRWSSLGPKRDVFDWST